MPALAGDPLGPAGPVIRPTPSDEEAAAIMAAIDGLWPRPRAATRSAVTTPSPRFSGRWWSASALSHRRRTR